MPEASEASLEVASWVGAWAAEECNERSCTDTMVAVFPNGFGWVYTVGMQGAGDSGFYVAQLERGELELRCDEPEGCYNGGGGRTIPRGETVVTIGGSPSARTFRWNKAFVQPPPLERTPTTGACCCASYDFESGEVSFATVDGGACDTCLPSFAADECGG